jgi:hypothetical protein
MCAKEVPNEKSLEKQCFGSIVVAALELEQRAA